MPTRYTTLDLVESEFHLDGSNAPDRDLVVIYLDIASRRIEEHCRRRFDLRTETRRYDAAGRHIPAPNVMHLDEDLIGLTSITNGDGSSIDLDPVILWPYNAYPKSRVILAPEDEWMAGESGYAAIQITGTWGYHTRPGAAWQQIAAPVPAGGAAAGDSEIVFSGDADIKRGHILKIGGEQMSAEDVVKTGDPVVASTAVTVERGINGTEAADHEAGADVFVYLPEPTIQRAAMRLTVWLYRQRDAPFEKVVLPQGEVVVPPGMPADVRAMLLPLVRKDSAGVAYAI